MNQTFKQKEKIYEINSKIQEEIKKIYSNELNNILNNFGNYN